MLRHSSLIDRTHIAEHRGAQRTNRPGHRARTGAALLAILPLLGQAGLAHGQCSGRFLPTIPDDHGLIGQQVNAMTQWDPDGSGPLQPITIMAGAIAVPGVDGARNVVTWTPRGFDGVWGSLGDGVPRHVFDITIFNGQPVVGIQFTTQPGQPASCVLRWTGSVWEPMGTIAGSVNTLQVFNGQLYAGGDFTIAGTQTFQDIARWNGSAWVTAAGTGTASGRVLDMTVYNGQLIAAGEFDTISGVIARNIARFNGTTWSPVSVGTDNIVTSLAVHGSDLIVGGHFGHVAGDTLEARFIARWNGTSWNTMGTGMNHRVWALQSHNGRLYAGGQFTSAGGVPVSRVAYWNGTTWNALGVGTDNTVNCFNPVTTSDLMIGGYFDHAGGLQTGRVAKYISDKWSALGVGSDSTAYTFTVAGGYLYMGGSFRTMDGFGASALARWNGGLWQQVQNGMYSSVTPGVYSLVTLPGVSPLIPNPISAGGSFTHAGGAPGTLGSVAARNIATYDAGITALGWHALGAGTDSGITSAIYAQAMVGANLYAGGRYSTISGVSALGLAHWTGSSWVAHSLPGFSVSMGDAVNAILPVGGQIIVGGRFEHSGLQNIAVLTGSTWSSMGLGMDDEVKALTLFNGQIVAGGRFDFAGVGFSHGLARWTGTDWAPIGTGLPRTDVAALAVYNGNLYAGGYEESSNAAVIRKWNGSTWTTIYQGAGATSLEGLAVYNNELIAGGKFENTATNSRNWLRWSDMGKPWFVESPAARTVGPLGSASLSAKPVFGYEVFGQMTYQWRRNGVAISNGPGGASAGGGSVSGASGVLEVGESAELLITGVMPSDQGSYDCVISTPCGSGTSPSAPLTVVGFCPVDYNQDGIVDFSDYLDFLSLFDAGDLRADLDDNGIVDFGDYLEFLNHFDAGC